MRTMVTGGAGFIGSTLVERLLAEGHQVDVVDDLSTGSLANLADARASGGRGLTIHHLDIRLPDLVELMVHRRPEVIFHLAAHDEVEDSIRHPGLDAEVNVLGSLNVMEGARSAGSERIVFAASGLTLYGAPLPADLPVRESHVHRPISPTGVSKKAVLDYLVAYRELHAVEFVALALANVYGPRQRVAAHGVVAAFARALVSSSPPTIFGDGKQTRDFVYVDDVADAFVRAATRGGGLVCNIGTGKETSVDDLYRLMAAEAGVTAEPEWGPPRPTDPRRSSLNVERAGIQLGWSSWTALADGVRAVLEDAARARPRRQAPSASG